ncbi:hypothetical protein GJ744_000485 [Endocarpon pusillum]|uniref:F-box domain-containing protein n=1 Tax=Endocarpon pusillum TaxID=364733 RepID=A0A8H7E055_9EURO|nr:hypothetical protein GJ744_000485 [Endocarpon pusillum]
MKLISHQTHLREVLGIGSVLCSTGSNLESLPNELLINIFSHLSGQVIDFQCLMLTCHRFHSLLTRHSHAIVNAVASRTFPTEKIILFNLAQTSTKWSPFAWLATGQRMNATIDRILFHLERVGAFRDEDHIFRAGTTDEEPSHARRLLRTILLGVQMISMQGQWEARSDYVMKSPPDLLNSMVRQLEWLVKFLICNAYLYIEGMDAEMGGTEDRHHCPRLLGVQVAFAVILKGEVLAQGPSLLLQLLEMKPKFRRPKEFLEWLWRICRGKEPWRLQREYYLKFILDDLFYWVSIEHRARWLGQQNAFGIKYPRHVNLTRWLQRVPDEEAWVDLMYERGWIKPVRKFLNLPSQD